MAKITGIEVQRFKSIKHAKLELGPINILIGANGSGKSNLISFFRLLHAIAENKLQKFVGVSGGAETLLYYGAKESTHLEGNVSFSCKTGLGRYYFQLGVTATDSLIFSIEDVVYPTIANSNGKRVHLGDGHKESLMVGEDQYLEVWELLNDSQVFHFNDASESSAIRKHGYIDDNRSLRNDGGNLAAFLYSLNKRQPQYYRRIRDTIRLIAPFFDDFVLEPTRENGNAIRLNWKDRNSNYLFGPHQLSDGTLRAMALVTLLLQPEDDLPPVIILDEPEIGLHPYAIEIVASLIQSASVHATLVAATQSIAVLNHFQPEDVIVVNRNDAQSKFNRLDRAELAGWLEDYSLGDLWAKNDIGGAP